MVFKSIITILSLTSAYVYAFQAAFEEQLDNHFLLGLDIFFEAFFLLGILINFLVEYQEEGQS